MQNLGLSPVTRETDFRSANVNSIWNKFQAVKFIIDHNIDIFLVSEIKLDDSFPTTQFLIKGFSALYRFDRKSKGDGLLLYISEDVATKILAYSSNFDIETLLVEINLKKKKVAFEWFL